MWTQVITFVGQALYLMSHLHSPRHSLQKFLAPMAVNTCYLLTLNLAMRIALTNRMWVKMAGCQLKIKALSICQLSWDFHLLLEDQSPDIVAISAQISLGLNLCGANVNPNWSLNLNLAHVEFQPTFRFVSYELDLYSSKVWKLRRLFVTQHGCIKTPPITQSLSNILES